MQTKLFLTILCDVRSLGKTFRLAAAPGFNAFQTSKCLPFLKIYLSRFLEDIFICLAFFISFHFRSTRTYFLPFYFFTVDTVYTSSEKRQFLRFVKLMTFVSISSRYQIRLVGSPKRRGI